MIHGGPVMYKKMKYGGRPVGESDDFMKCYKPTAFPWLSHRSDRIGRNPQTGWGKPQPTKSKEKKTDRELWLERIGIDVRR